MCTYMESQASESGESGPESGETGLELGESGLDSGESGLDSGESGEAAGLSGAEVEGPGSSGVAAEVEARLGLKKLSRDVCVFFFFSSYIIW